ncbi:MAG TPA: hypothetical protein VNI77_00675, partial [Nitrososphaera sp.]|nr:hypothetical protein [Nitrososphaera sp.]
MSQDRHILWLNVSNWKMKIPLQFCLHKLIFRTFRIMIVMTKQVFSRFVRIPFRHLSIRTRLFLGVVLLFFTLVGLGIHGSSTGITASWWAPEKPFTGHLIDSQKLPVILGELAQAVFLGPARFSRWDEYLVGTPLALSQLSHNPRFPVVNTNLGEGQNALISFHAPVWHITALARPATWGYFFLGAQRGLAWYWWFQVFACFVALCLLLEIILQGNRGLAAFGAFWFCGSAYIVAWSLWPAQFAFFAAL